MYIALQRMQVDGDWREPGEPVPEAGEWKNVNAYLGTRIQLASTDEEIAATIARATGQGMNDISKKMVADAHEAEEEFFARRRAGLVRPPQVIENEHIVGSPEDQEPDEDEDDEEDEKPTLAPGPRPKSSASKKSTGKSRAQKRREKAAVTAAKKASAEDQTTPPPSPSDEPRVELDENGKELPTP